ncbi:MAG: ATP synthase F1 subunit delta [Candidatus Woesearchaeota archaeon]
MVSIVYKRYAQALYSVALNNNKVEDIQRDVIAIKEVLTFESQLAKVLCHPRINENEKLSLLKNIFEGRVNNEVIGLLTIVLRKNRQQFLVNIFDEFLNFVRKGKNISVAIITSAIPLNDVIMNEIHQSLVRGLNKEIELHAKVDEKVMGGLKVQVDNMIFDRTIKGRLEQLKKVL